MVQNTSKDLILNKQYKNVVFINYIAGTQLFILRCIYDIYRNSEDVDCVIVSINDLFEFDFEEEYFFNNLNELTHDKFDVIFFNNGKKHEAVQQSSVFSTLLEAGIKDVVYLHEDCFIQTRRTIEKFFDLGRNINVTFVGQLWNVEKNGYRLYRGHNHLFYLNLEKANKIFNIKNDNPFAGQSVDENTKVDPGLGLYAKYLHDNPDEVFDLNPNQYVLHRGNMFDSYKITIDHYCVFNDLINFKDAVEWVARNSVTPMFTNHLYMKQYSYMVNKIDQYDKNEEVEFIDHVYWMVNSDVISINGASIIQQSSETDEFERNRYNPEWFPPTDKYIWQEHLEVWTKDV